MATSIKQALADLTSGKQSPVYFLYGEEPYKIEEFIERIKTAVFGKNADLTFCMDHLDGELVTGNDILERIQSIGIFSKALDSRIVIVSRANQVRAIEPVAKALIEAKKESPWGSNILILVSDILDQRKKFHQWLKAQGYALEFKPATDAELIQWVGFLTKKKSIQIEEQAAQSLAISSAGLSTAGSLHRLVHEIDKCWLYAGGSADTCIQLEHVASVATATMSHEMVELVDSILGFKKTQALILASHLIQTHEDALGLVGFLTWKLKNKPVLGINRNKFLKLLVELEHNLKSLNLDAKIQADSFIMGVCLV